MKLLLSALAVIAASATLGTPAQAQNYPWCAQYSGGSGWRDELRFRQFCAVHGDGIGAGGFCVVNTQYEPPPGPHPQRRHPY